MTKRALIPHLAVVSAASLSLTSGFAPRGIVTNRPLSSKNSHHARITPTLSSVASEGEVTDADIVALSTNPTLNLTPEGYGFSSPISRVVQNSGTGYYRAKSSESVVDVMENIGKTEVALVFSDEDGKGLMGIFTDYDFIRLSTELARYART